MGDVNEDHFREGKVYPIVPSVFFACNVYFFQQASIVTVTPNVELVWIDKYLYNRVLKDKSEELRIEMQSLAGLEVNKRFRSNKDIVRSIFLKDFDKRTERDLKFAVEYLKGDNPYHSLELSSIKFSS